MGTIFKNCLSRAGGGTPLLNVTTCCYRLLIYENIVFSYYDGLTFTKINKYGHRENK